MNAMINFELVMAVRFAAWAEQYLNCPPTDDKRQITRPCLAILLGSGDFTMPQLKEELRKNHIQLHEKYFYGLEGEE